MIGLIIAKFGGTSVADYDTMNLSADIILAYPTTKLVLLSASAGVTNMLIALSKGLEESERFIQLKALRKIQSNIMERMRNPETISKGVENLLKNISILAEAAFITTSDALTDELISHGELISTLLFVEILRERNIQAQWFDIRKIMRTSDRFGHAEPDITALAKLASQKLIPCLAKGLVITQGFIGSECRGRTTTLGRGGSDYTATLLGEALQAIRIDIWTDVPGIYTTDPRVVPSAKRIDVIAFEEAAKMATFGAQILHPATLLPALRSDIPVFIGSSKEPQAGGTLVCKSTKKPPLFRALALRREQILLTLHNINTLHMHNFLSKLFIILTRYNILINLIIISTIRIALTLDNNITILNNNTLLINSIITELSEISHVEIEDNLALVTIIGNKLYRICNMHEEMFDTLNSFNVRMICYGISGCNLCLLVPSLEAEQVLQKLHQILFE